MLSSPEPHPLCLGRWVRAEGLCYGWKAGEFGASAPVFAAGDAHHRVLWPEAAMSLKRWNPSQFTFYCYWKSPILLLKQSCLFVCVFGLGFFYQTPLEAIYLHISQKGKTTGHTWVNHFWKWQIVFENERTSPYRKKGKKYIYIINFSSAPLFLYFILLKRRALFCGVTLKSRTHTHKTKKHFPFVLTRGCAVIIYRFW